MAKDSLAVIIPAYKSEFLDRTLESLCRQTDRDFTVYIGDDCSPNPIEETVRRWTDRMRIVYRRFDSNLGGVSLVKHWNRCLEMAGEEEFFCMFSDDDIMEENCIASFRRTVREHPGHDVYHFDISIIGPDDAVMSECPPFPPEISAEEFFTSLYLNKIDARMPEFVFRRDNFAKCGGFVEFKKAYRSDNATVMTCAAERGIRTVSGEKSRVRWRDSGTNVSCIRTAEHLAELSDANVDFFSWTHRHFSSLGIRYPLPVRTEAGYVIYPLKELKPYLGSWKALRMALKYNPGKDLRYRLKVLEKAFSGLVLKKG